ncbi:pyruvate kinase [Marinicella meishanensis]|uniref:pyruvate kinase n=1 Tax=Marinicella meishanensis TaxID=2873263 RepID=UPI001CC1294C|nr:pyruvate kinase [Marinicella sp. NBU2979]
MKRKTKIVATLGPASQSPAQIEALIRAGVNVFRLNFSHGTAADHQRHVDNIRTVAAELGVLVGILQDLQGPKIRVGTFADGPIDLQEGEAFLLHPDPNHPGDQSGVGISYADLHADVAVGHDLLLDDGRLILQVQAIKDRVIHTRVSRGGLLSNNKGINVPDADLSIAAVTDKDIADIATGAQLDVDWVALSFVRSQEDLLLARQHLEKNQSSAKLMAKIEKPGAIRNYKEILRTADGIMVARGDLGVELSPEKVPMLQKRLIRKAREKGKPVITATQMLETMTENPIPTRAEANDVANAIFDGTDAVMLSAETATGKHPIKAVQTMDRIAMTVEADNDYRKRMRDRKFKAEKNTPDAVSFAACHIATTLAAEVMCCFSSSGATALRVARNRIHTDVIAISPSFKSCNQLTVSWGINPVLNNDATSTDEMVEIANQVIKQQNMAQAGDQFVITAGVPFGHSGTTNLIRVETLD